MDSLNSPRQWSVSDLTRYIRETFEHDYRLQALAVKGEVSNLRVPASGHAYFTLKDAGAQLKCVMWKSAVMMLAALPQDGEQVIAQGKISVYEAGGQYQLYCDAIQAAGVGDLHAQFEALKNRLQAEGLFDAERKRPLPDRPARIGIATSVSTAALQDVLNVLRRRYPLARVVLADTPVQGEQAPAQIIAALDALNAYGDLDVILLVRGGGSLEDLWCFNDEGVARAVASSALPVITGIGHEIDFTLADFAADLRAPTPSAAAEQVTPLTVEHLREAIRLMADRAVVRAEAALAERRQSLDLLDARLARLSPAAAIETGRQQVQTLLRAAGLAARNGLQFRREHLSGLQKLLNTMNPDSTLARGYAIVYDESGRILSRASDSSPGAPIDVQLAAGSIKARVESIEP